MTAVLSVPQLEQLANQVRQSIVHMLAAAGSGHAAGALGLSDIMTVLYFQAMKLDPARPSWSERDMLVMSNGHCAPVLYAVLAQRGFFPAEELTSLRRFGTRLQGHPERLSMPGIETTSGPLGSGLSQAVGMAYHLRHLQPALGRHVYCLLGDGELDEGNIWEAAMCAAKYRLGNLTAIVDRNNIQIGGSTEEVMPLGDVRAKWQSFGWHVEEVDGHAMGAISEAFAVARAIDDRPSVIIAHTVPGKGVDFMEYDYRWHGKAPNPTEAAKALHQLETNRAKEE